MGGVRASPLSSPSRSARAGPRAARGATRTAARSELVRRERTARPSFKVAGNVTPRGRQSDRGACDLRPRGRHYAALSPGLAVHPVTRVVVALLVTPAPVAAQAARVEISVPAALRAAPLTGRMYVFVTRHADVEPRLQVRGESDCIPFFGVDVTQLAPGTAAIIDGATLGYPLSSLRDIPAGDYYLQALVNVYTEFHPADGHTLWLHDDQWEGQQFNPAPGNLASDLRQRPLDPAPAGTRPLQ